MFCFFCSGAGLQVNLQAVVTFVLAKVSSLSAHSRLEGHVEVIFPSFQSLEGVAGLPVRDVRGATHNPLSLVQNVDVILLVQNVAVDSTVSI